MVLELSKNSNLITYSDKNIVSGQLLELFLDVNNILNFKKQLNSIYKYNIEKTDVFVDELNEYFNSHPQLAKIYTHDIVGKVALFTYTNSLEKGKKMINYFLDYALYTLTKFENTVEINELGKLITELGEYFGRDSDSQIEYNGKKVKLIIENKIKKDSLKLKNNQGNIYFLLVNMIKNSIKYGKTTSKIEISLENSNDNIILTIKDDGKGFENPGKIFEEGYTTNGTGIGLTNLKDRINGEIEAENKKGALIVIKMLIIN